MEEVSVIGFGAMGSGIAELFAMNGYVTNIYEISSEIIKKNYSGVEWSLRKLAERGAIRESPSEIMGRLRFRESLADAVRNSDLIVEAVNENPDVKLSVFNEAGKHAPNTALLTTNTSSISITYLQSSLGDDVRGRFAGFHFFNPPVLMRLVEIVRGRFTTDDVVNSLADVARALSKTPVMVNRDVRGFVANRIFRALRYQSFILYMHKIYDYREIDSALMNRLGLPMGIFALTDFTGGVKIESEEAGLYDIVRKSVPDYEPSAGYDAAFREALKLMMSMVHEGRTGVAAGRGFYEYPGPGKWAKPDLPPELGERVNMLHLLAPMINQAFCMVDCGISTEGDIDRALKLGYNWPRGIFEIYRQDYGPGEGVGALRELQTRIAGLSAFYEPDRLLLESSRRLSDDQQASDMGRRGEAG